jgi:hypothetical protein
MNKREAKVLRLWKERLDIRTIARRLGYEGSSLTSGIEKVKAILKANGIQI